jgi:hypothetical protein
MNSAAHALGACCWIGLQLGCIEGLVVQGHGKRSQAHCGAACRWACATHMQSARADGSACCTRTFACTSIVARDSDGVIAAALRAGPFVAAADLLGGR